MMVVCGGGGGRETIKPVPVDLRLARWPRLTTNGFRAAGLEKVELRGF